MIDSDLEGRKFIDSNLRTTLLNIINDLDGDKIKDILFGEGFELNDALVGELFENADVASITDL